MFNWPCRESSQLRAHGRDAGESESAPTHPSRSPVRCMSLRCRRRRAGKVTVVTTVRSAVGPIGGSSDRLAVATGEKRYCESQHEENQMFFSCARFLWALGRARCDSATKRPGP